MGTRRPFGPLSPYAPLRGALMGWVGHPAHMGTPKGCPLMQWVGHPLHMGHLRWPDNGDKEALWAPVPICTPKGCINGLGRAPSPYGHPKGAHYRSRFVFFYFGRSSTRLRLVTGSNGHPLGAHMHTLRVCIIMGALKGTHMCTPKGCTL